MCVKFNAATEEKKQQLEEEYNAHIKRKQDCYEAKVRDKARSMEDKEFMCCTFDLQCVLQIPSSDVSPMYYSRKICTYNLTIYELPPPNNAYCYLWTEMNGKRGSTEIGSCLYYYLQQLSETFKEITLYSDTCGGQNRNQNVAALCLFLVQTTRLTVIEHTFLESGHSYMEVDSMHSAIEHQQKFVPVYTVQDWINIFHLARSQRKKKNAPPYNVRELKFSDFFDLSQLSKLIMKNKSRDVHGELVNWLKVKSFRYLKNKPGILEYRYDHTSDYKEINVLGKGRPVNILKVKLSKTYKKMRPISLKKKTDLLKLCHGETIPEQFHLWYESLPVSQKVKDKVPAPAAEDSVSELSEESEVE
nr:unnamed protein product [Callosobruchus chinensis]